MQLKRNIKFFVALLTSTYGVWVLAQAQPQANGAALGSIATPGSVSATRTTGVEETAPSEVTTMDPMDPSRDSKMGSDATMGDRRERRARGPASGTVAPETAPSQTVPNTTY